VTVVVAAETLLLAVVGLFVVALLRSHAEILRRLEELAPQSSLPQPGDRAAGSPSAPALQGATPDGGARRVVLSPGQDTLLAFLSTSCSTCLSLLESAREAALPAELRLLVVSKDADVERLRLLRPVAEQVEILMSTAAWEAYDVPGSPYFVHVEGSTGQMIGEGSASTWEQVASLILDTVDDQAGPDTTNRGRIDDALAAAGIEPGHPSLHPAG
jgi:hypothetical protein